MKPIHAALTVLCVSAIPHETCSAEISKPNIVFVLADDLSHGDLSCFGRKKFATPNIDRLATQGRIFSNAYAGAPWCPPSRTALLTGMKKDLSAAHSELCSRATAGCRELNSHRKNRL